jgi:polysaccharide pyruvyl transferase WcaK-like protein
MKFVLPRTIRANRGDLASRWALLRALSRMEIEDYVVFAQFSEDIPEDIKEFVPYGWLRNAFPTMRGWKTLLRSNVVLWGCGLDLQDDSSLMKMLYLLILFRVYRFIGLEIWSILQGAGPINTKIGIFLARQVVKQVKVFVARDPKTLSIIRSLGGETTSYLGHDAIFLPDLESDLYQLHSAEKENLNNLFSSTTPTIGFNIRQWFHFSSSFLPYQFAKKKYVAQSQHKMQEILDAAIKTVQYLRTEHKARVLLISAYQPGREPWEDDLQWLQLIKKQFENDPEVVLVNQTLSMPAYYYLMSCLDLAIGMRLHTTLIALRFGVPSINISYTIKGQSILEHLGLSDYVLSLEEFMASPEKLQNNISAILGNPHEVRERVSKATHKAIEENDILLKKLFQHER